MNLDTAASILPPLVQRSASIHLVGVPGCGKSTFIENDLPAKMLELTGHNYAVVTLMLNCCEAPDIGGFKFPVKGEHNGKPVMRTVSSVPEVISLVRQSRSEHGILFLDERGQAPLDVQKAVAPLVLDGRAGNERLPEGWTVISASNRMKDKSGVNRAPMHLINREITLDIEPALQGPPDHNGNPTDGGWTKYASTHGVHPLFVAFALYRPGVVCGDGVPAEPVPYCTLRSFTELSHDLTAIVGEENIDGGLKSNSAVHEVATGRIGNAAAAELLGFLSIAGELKTWKQIMATPSEIKIPPGRLDIGYAYSAMVDHNITLENCESAMIFMTSCLPIEMQVVCVKRAFDRLGGAVLNNPHFRKWQGENTALIRGTLT